MGARPPVGGPGPADDAPPEDDRPADPTPAPSARDLVRGRRRAPRRADPGGRQHHIGDAPARMPVLRPDGTTGTTRTSVVQLRSAHAARLAALEAELEAEMRAEAAAGRYEEAAVARDELAAVRAEVAARAARAAPSPGPDGSAAG
ncbi:hypothetical protein [Pseudokineococcus lusitanus]|uniref:hypothetical protein n=1 Tax=Pseudokineococcus lusitanus TaxID=763993 RepID=UPI000F46EB65|nr:hypothetical protein [Pseudokineococcus lusitanus]